MLNMLTGGTIMGMINGAFSILGGIQQKSGAKKLASIQSQMNEKRREWNNKELAEAYKKNYADIMSKWSAQRLAIDDQFRNANSDINMKLSNLSMQGIDLDGSSVKNLMKDRLTYEFADSIQNYTVNIANESNAMYGQYAQQRLGVNLNAIQNDFNIQQQKIQSIAEANNKILQGAMQVGGGIFDMFQNSNRNARSENTTSSIGGINPINIAYGITNAYRDTFVPHFNYNSDINKAYSNFKR